jgi:hypothetical protein
MSGGENELWYNNGLCVSNINIVLYKSFDIVGYFPRCIVLGLCSLLRCNERRTMKQLSLTVPTGGKVIVVGRKGKQPATGQQDLFLTYREAWLDLAEAFIDTFYGSISMSMIRQAWGKNEKPAPAHPNWWGSVTGRMKRKWRITGYHKSPLASRAGGVEAVWDRK